MTDRAFAEAVERMTDKQYSALTDKELARMLRWDEKTEDERRAQERRDEKRLRAQGLHRCGCGNLTRNWDARGIPICQECCDEER